ncbi:MAG: glycosyltransferase family 2 protein, partial [Solirubrobacterales bacterium]
LGRTLPALGTELEDGDQVIVVDNGSTDELASVVSEHLPDARIETMGANLGFAAAVNRGAELAEGNLLLVLNPDARPEPGFGIAIRRPLKTHPDWAAWMGLVLYRENERLYINSAGNPVHFTGISWAGGHGEPAGEAGPEREVPTASGACLAMPLESWRRLGGFPEEFFLYQEDTDLSIRLRSANEKVGLLTEAKVDHAYEFGGAGTKWFWLERNRWAMIIRNYPAALLVLLLPALLATEIALFAAAASGGWLPEKRKAWTETLRWLPRLIGERRKIQAVRSVSARNFALILTPDLDSPFLPATVRRGPVRLALRAYWRVVLLLLPG